MGRLPLQCPYPVAKLQYNSRYSHRYTHLLRHFMPHSTLVTLAKNTAVCQIIEFWHTAVLLGLTGYQMIPRIEAMSGRLWRSRYSAIPSTRSLPHIHRPRQAEIQ